MGIYLSGGIEASVIAGMVTRLVKERGERIGNEQETDTVSCLGIAFDEDGGYEETAKISIHSMTTHLGIDNMR